MHTHTLVFVQDLAVIMLIAGLITVIFHRFKQPVVLGYIIAGIIIGPYTPPFQLIQDKTIINTLADVGVIFLMFALGLEFNLSQLKKIGFTVTAVALIEIILMAYLGYWIGQLLHWEVIDSIFLGAMLAISSTTIIIKALDDLGLKQQGFARFIFGTLILEDIFAIIILGLLSSIAVTGSLSASDVLFTFGKLSIFLVASLIVGILIIPRLLTYIAKFNNNEMLLISILGICFGFCLLVIKLDYSIALGAFIIGAIIAESRPLALIENLIAPIRDMFSAIFFVSVGLLFDPFVLIDYALPILGITAAVIVGKILSCTLGMLITGHDGKTSMRVGMGLAQIGEFSFIIASLGLTLHVTSSFLYPIAVAVSAVTTLLTPYLIKYSDPMAKNLAAIMPNKIAMGFEQYRNWIKSFEKQK